MTMRSQEITYLSKEDYLASRRIWKKQYMKTAANIRALKLAMIAANKGGWDAVRSFQSMKDIMGNEAHHMMDSLGELKKIARTSVIISRVLEGSNYSSGGGG